MLESTQRDVVERSALRDLYEQEYKKGAFELLLVRIQTIAAAPVEALATVLLVAAVLYGVVALSGRKPEWHTLLTICVFAGMIDALQRWVQLALMLHFQTLEVDTSAAALVAHWATANGVKPATAAVWSALAGALDPFRVWFWWVIVAGVITTAQLRRWRAWSVCTFLLADCSGRAGRARIRGGTRAAGGRRTADVSAQSESQGATEQVMRTVLGIVILAGLIAGVFALNHYTRAPDGKSRLNVAKEVETPVETAAPEQRTIVRTVQSPGEVESFEEVDISSEVVGKILDMPVEEGQVVEKGELLCQLDGADYRARVRSGEANVTKLRALIIEAEADLQKAELDWELQQKLHENWANSPLEMAQYRIALVRARAALDVRNAELAEAEATLQSAREILAKTVIKAPLSGVVAQRFAKPGEVVVTGTMNNPGTRIMVISDLSHMRVRCRVDEADAPLVASDQTARIFLQSDTRRSIPGRVLRVGTKGTKPTGRDVVTFETFVLITGVDPRIRPGMTASVEIEVARREQALTVPIQAVVYRKRRDVPETLLKELDAQAPASDAADRGNVAQYLRLVFCVQDGKARPRLVQTGVSDATGVELTSGVEAGDMIVTGPYRSLDQLKDGTAIAVQKKPAGAPTATEALAAAQATSAPTTAPGETAVAATTAPADTADEVRTTSAPATAPADEAVAIDAAPRRTESAK